MRDLIKPAWSLFIICAVTSLALAFTNIQTRDVIKARIESDADAARKEVLSDADKYVKIDDWNNGVKNQNDYNTIKEVYRGEKDGKTIGYVFRTYPKGYGGEIEMMVGVDSKGTLKGIKIGTNNETPGLGSKAADKKFTSQFSDVKSENVLSVVKRKVQNEGEIEAISGATITSNAVTLGAKQSVALYKEVLTKRGDK